MKALLLDTHALLWSLGEEEQLSPTAHSVLSAGVVPVYVSAASIWEIAIKKASGKLRAPEDLLEKVAAARFDALEITWAHASLAGALPAHHTDPFDRMIVAQALSDGLTVLTCDQRIVAYDVPVLW